MTVTRKTGETDITIKLNLDGSGKARIQTGIGFFDHMLNSFARHGLFDLEVDVKGDLKSGRHCTRTGNLRGCRRQKRDQTFWKFYLTDG